VGNRITSGVFKIFVGMTISDTQTGLRALTTENVKTLIQVAGDRFEYETNMLLAMKEQAIDFDEVKIRTVYIEENKSSHFHAIKDSWRIYKLILKHFFRYAISSIASAVIDEGMFLLLSFLLHGILQDVILTAVCTAGARLVSSIINFFMNHRLVFQSQASVGKSLVRYYALAIPQLIVQFLLTQGVFTLLNIADSQTLLRGLIYGLVMCVLFIVSFVIQQRWVFAGKASSKNK
jgi:putative flippase GtrA